MSLQIARVAVYSNSGELREIQFRTGSLNILTGGSRTGKTAIIDIVDYCMGKRNCKIPNRIQRSVSWFGVQFSNSGQEFFVARPSPKFPGTSTGDIYLERGRLERSPDSKSLVKNLSFDELRLLLSRESGIRENTHVPKPGQTRLPLQANIRHALWLCIQGQNDIADREKLFNGMDDTFSMNDLRHTLPYFLGAIDENRLITAAQLESAQRERRALLREVAMRQGQLNETDSAASALLEESRLAGLFNDDPSSDDIDPIAALESISRISLDGELGPVTSGNARISELFSERSAIRNELDSLRLRMHEVRLFSQEHASFNGEARQHRARLSSIQLYQDDSVTGNTCPVCSSELFVAIPKVEQIRESLARVTSILENADVASPRITQHLADLVSEENTLLRRLRDNSALTQSLEISTERLSSSYLDSLTQSRVIGKVEQYLAMRGTTDSSIANESQLKRLERLISNLEAELSSDRVNENIDTYLNFVSDYITAYAKLLALEYSNHRIRLDLGQLTLVADTREGAVPMQEMGSGENWVGYHVVAHLGLHRWFRENQRPVPAFLLLDQPSQAHYPRSESSNPGTRDHADEDDAAVKDIYRVLKDFTEILAPNMQVIVLDHPRFEEFNGYVVEEWRDGFALLPESWLVEPITEDEES